MVTLHPANANRSPASAIGAAEGIYVTVFSVLAIIFLKNFINILPYVMGSVTRQRMASEIEGSVRMSRDRNFVATILIIPLCLLVNRYGLYAPDFMGKITPGLRLLTVTGIVVVYLLLRALLSYLLKPKSKRVAEVYLFSKRTCYTLFIALMVFVLVSLGILVLFHVSDNAIRTVLLVEMALSYFVLLSRRTQILASVCTPFSLFLYLCALEILPTGLLIASALIF